MTAEPIAVVGMACRFPDAPDLQSYWRNMRDGRTSFKTLTNQRWNHSLFLTHARDGQSIRSHRAALLDDIASFAADYFDIPTRRALVMDPQQRLILEVAREALADAGLERRPYDRTQTATYVGAGISEYLHLLSMPARTRQLAAGECGEADEDAERLSNRLPSCRAFTLPGNLLNMCASVVSQFYDLGGPAMSVDAACASSLATIVHGVNYLRTLLPREPGVAAPIALAGGVYLLVVPDNLIAFSRIGALARDHCRPFDAAAEGFLVGEGTGMVVLKRLSDARVDGDRIYAVIRSARCNSDGRADSPMTPSLSGQLKLLRAGFRDAALDPATVDYVECHATATQVGDAVELEALREIFPSHHRPRLGAVKANLGHTLPAAGVAGFIRAALSVYHATLPPQAGFEKWRPDLESYASSFDIADTASKWDAKVRRATVNAFGFGGTNAFALIESAPPAERLHHESEDALPFCFSAPTAALLAQYLSKWEPLLAAMDPADLAATAYTLTCTREPHAWCVVLRAKNVAAIGEGITRSLPALAAATPAWVTGDNLLIGTFAADLPADHALSADARRFQTFTRADEWSSIFSLATRRLVDLPPVPLVRDRFWAVGPTKTSGD